MSREYYELESEEFKNYVSLVARQAETLKYPAFLEWVASLLDRLRVSETEERPRDLTIVEHLEAAAKQIRNLPTEPPAISYKIGDTAGLKKAQAQASFQVTHSHPSREFALALTAIEDAQMRTTRGLAIYQRKFSPADLQKTEDQS